MATTATSRPGGVSHETLFISSTLNHSQTTATYLTLYKRLSSLLASSHYSPSQSFNSPQQYHPIQGYPGSLFCFPPSPTSVRSPLTLVPLSGSRPLLFSKGKYTVIATFHMPQGWLSSCLPWADVLLPGNGRGGAGRGMSGSQCWWRLGG